MSKVSRYSMQQKLAAPVEGAVQSMEQQLGVSDTDPDAQRRVFRALVTLAVSRLADRGAPPAVILQQAVEAVMTELKRRHEGAVEQGQPFGPQPTGLA